MRRELERGEAVSDLVSDVWQCSPSARSKLTEILMSTASDPSDSNDRWGLSALGSLQGDSSGKMSTEAQIVNHHSLITHQSL